MVFAHLFIKCHPKIYRSEINYYMTVNIIFSVVFELRAWGKESSHERGASSVWLFTQIHFTQVLKVRIWNITKPYNAQMGPWWILCGWLWQVLDKFWQALGRIPKLPPGGSLQVVLYGELHVNGLSSILWLVMNASLFINIPLLITLFEHGCSPLARTTISLKIGQTLNSLSFEWKVVKSKYHTPKYSKFKFAIRAVV